MKRAAKEKLADSEKPDVSIFFRAIIHGMRFGPGKADLLPPKRGNAAIGCKPKKRGKFFKNTVSSFRLLKHELVSAISG